MDQAWWWCYQQTVVLLSDLAHRLVKAKIHRLKRNFHIKYRNTEPPPPSYLGNIIFVSASLTWFACFLVGGSDSSGNNVWELA